ncbi:glycosyltransferase family 9 protein [Chitinophaga nivalis]|uniref:Uncharacterized protein n=1 Tax=Chitinophaga nivalis TaxID=2991709 RepID=A0ABT3IPZ1_9BACT|nr:hypothetical protein [Chitinophaga nivalis]MCW3464495.1 hypothetical protein [Chitinophaga nivalis]MCW3485814.1 hypothetical protein [Chitinophaga nivalis]
MKKMLILADLHDLIHFQDVDRMLVQQLYVAVYISRYYHNNMQLHINNDSDLDYRWLWKEDSRLAGYLESSIIQQQWADINLTAYDYILCFHHSQHLLTSFLPAVPTSCQVFTFLNPKGVREQYQFARVDSLFRAGGAMQLEQAFIEGPLSRFKQEIKDDFIGFNRYRQESLYAPLLQKLTTAHTLPQKKAYRNILILDDYKRNFYIGDSTFWLRSIREALQICPGAEKITINCQDKTKRSLLQTLYAPTLAEHTHFSDLPWEELALATYDLVLFETDLMAKFLQHVQRYYPDGLTETAVYTITPFIDSVENPFKCLFNIDFFSCHANQTNPIPDTTHEIVVTAAERRAALAWLEGKGVQPHDRLIIILNGSSVDQKVIRFEVLIHFIKWLLATAHTKVLLFDEQQSGIHGQLQQVLDASAMNHIIIAEKLGIRKDLAILTSIRTSAIVGPCTGLFHLANGVYTYFLHHRKIKPENVPLMLVYTGKQHFDQEYTPWRWWKNSLIDCVILVKDDSAQHTFIPLEACPEDYRRFQEISVSPREITGALLTAAFEARYTGHDPAIPVDNNYPSEFLQ